METAKTKYLGDLRTEIIHLRSGSAITTDAPVDNKGRGENFSPTDMVASALGSCIFTIMGISAREHSFSIDGSKCTITKIMAENPRRVNEVIVEFDFPNRVYSEKEKDIIWHSARTCPVLLSLHPDLIKTIRMNFHED